LGVYVALVYTRLESKKLKLSKREQLLLLEIGRDRIDTASCFVDYIKENYGISKSSVWYCLNMLKEYGIAQFANKIEQGKPLCLTKQGLSILKVFESSKNEIVEWFVNSFLSKSEKKESQRYSRNYIDDQAYTL
jgi:hypothetical protein